MTNEEKRAAGWVQQRNGDWWPEMVAALDERVQELQLTPEKAGKLMGYKFIESPRRKDGHFEHIKQVVRGMVYTQEQADELVHMIRLMARAPRNDEQDSRCDDCTCQESE